MELSHRERDEVNFFELAVIYTKTCFSEVCEDRKKLETRSSIPCDLPGLILSDYHLFASTGHALAEQRFGSYEDVKKCLDEWFATKGEDVYWRGIRK